MSKIRIGHDNTGFGAAWFLDKVSCFLVVKCCQRAKNVTDNCLKLKNSQQITRKGPRTLDDRIYKLLFEARMFHSKKTMVLIKLMAKERN